MTVADLGILRDVAAEDERLVVTITPTYSGCPALREIAHDLRHRLGRAGFAEVTVRTALAPPGAATGSPPRAAASCARPASPRRTQPADPARPRARSRSP